MPVVLDWLTFRAWRHYSLQIEKETAKLFSVAYPLHIKWIVLVNLSLPARLLFRVAKMFRTKKELERYLAYKDVKSFFDSYSIPPNSLPPQHSGTMDSDNLQIALKEHLQARYQWAETFQL